jgi:hypothetical protein
MDKIPSIASAGLLLMHICVVLALQPPPYRCQDYTNTSTPFFKIESPTGLALSLNLGLSLSNFVERPSDTKYELVATFKVAGLGEIPLDSFSACQLVSGISR